MSDSSQYITFTTSWLPPSRTILDDSKLPMACIVRPFISDESPPLAIFHEAIIRCKECLTYMNPFVKFEEVCQFWKCNLCAAQNQTPAWYMAPVDEEGKRKDISKRPELSSLSYDIMATEDYMSRPPMPCVYYFVVDISAVSRDTEYLDTICSAIQTLIEKEAIPGMPRTMVGILAYDTGLHFVNLNPIQGQPTIYTVTDAIDEIYLPLPYQNFLVPLDECSDLLISALEMIREMPTSPFSTAFRSAIVATYQVLYNQGGKAIFFLADSLVESGHPKDLVLDLQNPFYKEQANNMNIMNISCDLFITCSQYCNVQTISEISKFTGGDVYYYPNFRGKNSCEKLYNEIWMNVTREIYWEAAFRLRANKDWKPKTVYGHFSIKSEDLLCLPSFNDSQTIVYELQMVNTTVTNPLQVQTAMLYTSTQGERRIRVHNYQVEIAQDLGEVYEKVNQDALMNIVTKHALGAMIKTNKLDEGRKYLENKCTEIVSVCMRSFGKLPASIETLPYSFLGMIKSPLFVNQLLGCN